MFCVVVFCIFVFFMYFVVVVVVVVVGGGLTCLSLILVPLISNKSCSVSTLMHRYTICTVL